MVSSQIPMNGQRVWLGWVVASAIGLATGFAVYFPLVLYLGPELSPVFHILLATMGGTFFGALLGTAQRLFLRRYSIAAGRWLLATIVAGAVGGTLALIIGEVAGDARGFYVALAVGGIVLGAAIGLGQWLVLRPNLSQAGWWVLASTAGLAISLGTGNALGATLFYALDGVLGESLAQVLAILTLGAFLLIPYGAVTGAALLWLLRRQADVEQDRRLGVESPRL